MKNDRPLKTRLECSQWNSKQEIYSLLKLDSFSIDFSLLLRVFKGIFGHAFTSHKLSTDNK